MSPEEKEKILNIEINSILLKDMSGEQFYLWVLSKLNGQYAYDSIVQELTNRANTFTVLDSSMGNTKEIMDEEKIEMVEKLQELNIET